MWQAILFYSGDTSVLIKEDETDMKYHGDDSEEKVNAPPNVDPVQKKKCLPGIEPEATKLK